MTTSDVLDTYQTSTRAAEANVADLKKGVERLTELAVQVMRLVGDCARYPEELQALWAQFEGKEPAGTPGHLRPWFEKILGLLESRLRITAEVQLLVVTVMPLGEGRPRDVATLTQTIQALEDMRARVKSLWGWMNESPPPNKAMAAESRADIEAGRAEDVADILERVKAGGAFFPE
jgi:hypothetical protein